MGKEELGAFGTGARFSIEERFNLPPDSPDEKPPRKLFGWNRKKRSTSAE